MEDAHAQQAGPAWAAPAAAGPVRARLAIPGSKSETNRALVLAALAGGPGIIRHPLRARDTLLMRQALTALGATIGDATDPDNVLYGSGGAKRMTVPALPTCTLVSAVGWPGITCQPGDSGAPPGA